MMQFQYDHLDWHVYEGRTLPSQCANIIPALVQEPSQTESTGP